MPPRATDAPCCYGTGSSDPFRARLDSQRARPSRFVGEPLNDVVRQSCVGLVALVLIASCAADGSDTPSRRHDEHVAGVIGTGCEDTPEWDLNLRSTAVAVGVIESFDGETLSVSAGAWIARREIGSGAEVTPPERISVPGGEEARIAAALSDLTTQGCEAGRCRVLLWLDGGARNGMRLTGASSGVPVQRETPQLAARVVKLFHRQDLLASGQVATDTVRRLVGGACGQLGEDVAERLRALARDHSTVVATAAGEEDLQISCPVRLDGVTSASATSLLVGLLNRRPGGRFHCDGGNARDYVQNCAFAWRVTTRCERSGEPLQ